jgi:nonsense-mediated mRNA decay protein 3
MLHEQGLVACCECGTPIAPNNANMCVGCLRSRVDITEGILRQCKSMDGEPVFVGNWLINGEEFSF